MFFLREEGTEDSEECWGTHLRGPRSGMSLIRKKGPSAGERWLSQKGAIFLGPLPGWKLCGILDKGWGWNQTSLCLNSGLTSCSVYNPLDELSKPN